MATLKKTETWFLKPNYRVMKIKSIEHSAILPSFIKLPIVIKIFVMSIFEWPFYTSFTVPNFNLNHFHEMKQSRLLTMFLLQKWSQIFR